MRTITLVLTGLLWLGCGSDASTGGGEDVGDTSLEVETTAPEETTATDGTADSAPETEAPDVEPDTADTTPAETEVAEEVETEVETEVVGPAVLAIARGDHCDALTELPEPALPFSDEGDTTAASDDYIYASGEVCGGTPGLGILGDASPDLVYAFTPELSATYRIELTPSGDFDPGLMVTDACPPIGEDGFEALTCVGVSDQGKGAPEVLNVELVAGVRYFLLIDGWSNDEPVSGSFALTIDLGENCDDDVDNNDDGAIDCADPHCAADLRCNEALYDEGCNNDLDDDGDGATDCADDDCDGSPLCNEATAGGCANDIDDEGDGLTDCADPDCSHVEHCDEATYEAGCENELDDDGDGLSDCDDPDCGFESACLTVGETCESAVPLVLGVPTRGTTNGRSSEYGSSVASCTLSTGFAESFGLAAPDAAFVFTPPASGKYLFETESDFDDALTVTSDCTFAAGALCFGVERRGTGGERLVVDLVADTAVFVIVDGWSNTSETNTGEFTLTVRRATSENAELVCDDQTDSDLDGDVDCADVDCAFDRTHCVEIGNCDDEIDNDGDDDIDCDDSDCRGDIVACPPPAGDNCTTPAMIEEIGTPVMIDTCEFGVDFMFAPDAGCVIPTFDSPDGVVGFTAPGDALYLAEVTSSDMDSIVSMVRSDTCPPAAVTACDAADDDTDTQRVPLDISAGETAWLLVSAYGDDWFEEPGCGVATVTVFEVEPEVCDDESDNDRDGESDCADEDCALAPNCNESQNGPDACSDEADNDDDGVSDCFDIDCAGTAACPDGIPGDSCASALEGSGPLWTVQLDSCILTNHFTATESGEEDECEATSSSASPKDMVARYDVAEAGDYVVQFDPGAGGGTSFDALLNVVRGADCPESPLTVCAAGSDRGDPERVTVAAEPGDTLWIIAGGWSSGCGMAELAVWKIGPEVCGDGVDNDMNGQRDCADAACDEVAECVEICDDKIDNDEDGKFDCDDSACDQSPFCNEAVNGPDACSNGTDDDDDGVADCYDADCAESDACPNGTIGDTCQAAPLITSPSWEATFATCDYVSDFEQSSTGGCRTMGGAGDVIAQLVAEEDGDYQVSYTSGQVSTPTFDSVINVIESAECPSGEVETCVAGVDDGIGAATESLTFSATAGETYWIVADGYGSGCGVATLAVTRLEDEVCDDGADNDGDGDTDCDDPECRANEPLVCPTPPGDVCGDDAIEIGALPFSDETLDTCQLARDYSADDLTCNDYDGAEGVYRYTAESDITLQVSVVSLDLDTGGDLVDLVLSARTGCPTTSVLSGCLDTADDELDLAEELQVDVSAGETIYLFAAPYYVDDCTRLHIEVFEAP